MRLRTLLLILVVWQLAAGACWAGLQARYSLYGTIGGVGRGRSELKQPVDVAMTEDGDLAIVEASRESIVVYGVSGRWIRTLGKPRGKGPVELDRPVAIEAIDEHLWIVDQGNNRIVVIDEKGLLLHEFGSMGIRRGRFRQPSDLTVDRGGLVYVADTGNRRIQLFNSRGEFVEEWKSGAGRGRDKIVRPVALAYSVRDREIVWIANRESPVLEKFDLEGKWVGSLDLTELVEGEIEVGAITTDKSFGRLFVSDTAGNRILVVKARGDLATEIAFPEGNQIGGLALNRQLKMYVAGGKSGQLVIFDRK